MEPTLEETRGDYPIRFRVRTLLWAVTLLGVGMGTFGPRLGVYLTFLTTIFHGIFVSIRTNRKLVIRLLFLIVITHFVLFPASFFSALQIHGARPRPASSMSCLKTIQVLSWILDYETIHGRFPKPYTTDSEGNSLHSWRTSLPFVEEVGRYTSIDREKPWDTKENLELFKACEIGWMRSPLFKNRIKSVNVTNYLAIVDKETVWDPENDVKMSDITDGPENTIVLIEVLNKKIPWYEPRDLSLEEAIDILVGEPGTEWIRPGFFYSKRLSGDGYSKRVGLANGNDMVVAPIASRETARALLTYSGGEELPTNWGTNYSSREDEVLGYVIHWGRIGSTLLFVALALMPLWQPKARRAESE